MSAPERGAPGTWQHLAFWDNSAMALGATQAGLPISDLSAAWLIATEWAGGLHYAVGTKTWYIWNGRAHLPDASMAIEKIIENFAVRMTQMLEAARGAVADDVMRRLPADAKDTVIAQQRAKAWEPWAPAAKYAAKLATQAGKTALRGYLESHCGVEDEYMAERWPGLLNLANGTLDLATLELRRHRREDMITYVLPDPWVPNATAPRFWDLILRMFGGDAELALYLIRVLGYCLLGDNREQKIIFLSGPSGSGKSVLLHVISQVLGPLAHASGAELITVVSKGRNARKENSIRGVRLATITETSKFMTVDEGQLKRITGEQVISVDQHYAKTEIKTPVTWTIVVATNDMPNLVNFDAAMRRRILVIPTGRGLAEWEMDTQMAAKILSTERQGILRALAWGCTEYFRLGIRDLPASVAEASEGYAAEQNTVANFVQDTMVLGGWSTDGGIAQHQAWELYEQWSRGGPRLGRNEFMAHLADYPGVSWVKSSRRFVGVAWNADWAIRVR